VSAGYEWDTDSAPPSDCKSRGRVSMKLINLYEVMDRKGDVAWGGASVTEAVEWFRRGLDNAIFVSVWNEEDIRRTCPSHRQDQRLPP
jgi:hypothetical protein